MRTTSSVRLLSPAYSPELQCCNNLPIHQPQKLCADVLFFSFSRRRGLTRQLLNVTPVLIALILSTSLTESVLTRKRAVRLTGIEEIMTRTVNMTAKILMEGNPSAKMSQRSRRLRHTKGRLASLLRHTMITMHGKVSPRPCLVVFRCQFMQIYVQGGIISGL